jgi:hypothetical protein
MQSRNQGSANKKSDFPSANLKHRFSSLRSRVADLGDAI